MFIVLEPTKFHRHFLHDTELLDEAGLEYATFRFFIQTVISIDTNSCSSMPNPKPAIPLLHTLINHTFWLLLNPNLPHIRNS